MPDGHDGRGRAGGFLRWARRAQRSAGRQVRALTHGAAPHPAPAAAGRRVPGLMPQVHRTGTAGRLSSWAACPCIPPVPAQVAGCALSACSAMGPLPVLGRARTRTASGQTLTTVSGRPGPWHRRRPCAARSTGHMPVGLGVPMRRAQAGAVRPGLLSAPTAVAQLSGRPCRGRAEQGVPAPARCKGGGPELANTPSHLEALPSWSVLAAHSNCDAGIPGVTTHDSSRVCDLSSSTGTPLRQAARCLGAVFHAAGGGGSGAAAGHGHAGSPCSWAPHHGRSWVRLM